MGAYQPLKITGMTTGLVRDREQFILPDDAYPVLLNAYVWRERIKRKQGCQFLARLQRNLTGQALGNTDGGGAKSVNIKTTLGLETNAQIKPTTVSIAIGAQVFTDPLGDGALTNGAGGTGTINYSTMVMTLQTAPVLAGAAVTAAFSYFPNLPVMGLRPREISSISVTPTIAFDTKYAYQFVTSAWQEWIPGTTWTGTNSQFFWSTNYWVNTSNTRIFWATNYNIADPIRYTDGTSWAPFAPQITSTPTYLQGALAMVPFRGRMVAFHTKEGTNAVTPYTGTVEYAQRIRWAAIGTPFSVNTGAPAVSVNANAWRDDIRGQGGYLDIPTSESITAIGFVRDNLVIYCERSTWQLRYTQNAIAPFAIERVNSELGAGSLFSAIQFDTSLVGIGDKGVITCDAFKSERIDPQIPNLVFNFSSNNDGTRRVQGARDYINKLAYWIYPYAPQAANGGVYPNYRLVYNYDNNSWAVFNDYYTALGQFQPLNSESWSSTSDTWAEADYAWFDRPANTLDIIAGNQQGYTFLLDNQTYNDPSLTITSIAIASGTVQLTVPAHNLPEATIVQIANIPTGTGFDTLNNGIFAVEPNSSDTLLLYSYNSATDEFVLPVSGTGTYAGYGEVRIRDNFVIQSKKFNFIDDGQNVQLGYLDILVNSTEQGAISLYVFQDYNDSTPVNILSENQSPTTNLPDTFFNSVVPTTQNGGLDSEKVWVRVFCPVRSSFITLVWTLSNAQMIGNEQTSNVQIDAQILWLRKAGRLQSIGA